MKSHILFVVSATAVSALLSPVNSPCAVNCGNVLSSTASDEIQCSESSFSSGAGAVLKSCVKCQVESTFYNSDLTDVGAGLYNLRYASAFCLFGIPDGEALASPCITSTACGPLMNALNFNNLATNSSSYDYCSIWQSTAVQLCMSCLGASSQSFLRNYITTLNTGCQQLPANGTAISIEGDIFSTQVVNATVRDPLSTFTPESFVHNGISLSAKVAISFAALVFLLTITGTGIICQGRRRRRAFLRTLEKKPSVAWAGSGSPLSPTQAQHYAGTGKVASRNISDGSAPGWAASIAASLQRYTEDVNETPLSQKPLRGWDDSPLSPVGEKNIPSSGRYISPYSSQYGSPVSGAQEIPKSNALREIDLKLRCNEFELQEVGGQYSEQHDNRVQDLDTPVLRQPSFSRLSGEGGPRTYSPQSGDLRRAG
ncbi:hypothetical protein CFIMG_004856RA [Ceratocystis fimbriata CBS 114723]|uniref:LPXTG-domain-containing protein n=1 Tax=Ceratocystis fimbriata CBS 114723 TaxID=1035309 RepID=A0A2C5X2Y5_9PEZI|nr:hypothetical protein CFIMG_004856RA [Ceratocystis fimbriata CBS 114723]